MEITEKRVNIICEAYIEDNTCCISRFKDGTTVFLRNIGFVSMTYQSSGSYEYGPDNCVIIEDRTEEVKELIDIINGYFQWEKYGDALQM